MHPPRCPPCAVNANSAAPRVGNREHGRQHGTGTVGVGGAAAGALALARVATAGVGLDAGGAATAAAVSGSPVSSSTPSKSATPQSSSKSLSSIRAPDKKTRRSHDRCSASARKNPVPIVKATLPIM